MTLISKWPMTSDASWTARLLVAGLVIFFIGAALWLPSEFQAASLVDCLRHIAARPARWRWIHAWMACGLVIELAGVRGLCELLREAGERLATPIAATLFQTGAVLWLLAMALRVTIQEWAATETIDGALPAVYPSVHRLAGLLHASHMILSYLAAAGLGAGVLRSGILPSWLGWTGVVAGSSFALAFGAFRVGLLGMPFLALVYPCLLGVQLWRLRGTL